MPEENRKNNDFTDSKYMRGAKLLAEDYTRMLDEQKRLQKRLAGSWVYTIDMAIDELNNITVSYESERVQSSNISNPTERIALKLTDAYMAKKQKEMDAEREACAMELDYVNWKVGVVEAVIKERLDDELKDIFTLQYKGHKTYEETQDILQKKRKRSASRKKIIRQKREILELLSKELELRESVDDDRRYINILCRDAELAEREENNSA